jgi:glyoxylate/hydroxypyruvate reductase
MRLVFQSDTADPAQWRDALQAEIPGLDVRIWPDTGDPANVDAILVWRIPPGVLELFPNLKLIQLISAGADQVAFESGVPSHIPVARLVEPTQVVGMVEYILHAVLEYHRDFHRYREQHSRHVWREHPRILTRHRRVGVMGLGALGEPVARALASFGFDVSGWARRPREIEGVEVFSGAEMLEAFLARNSIVAALLPLTRETHGMFDAGFFAMTQPGSYFINAGRGAQCVEPDLIRALESGRLAGATIDVLKQEPLGRGDRLWSVPNLTITPHIATSPDPHSAAKMIAENLRRAHRGEPPQHPVELDA